MRDRSHTVAGKPTTRNRKSHTAKIDEEAQALFDKIAVALIAGDGEGVAALWETPAFVIGAQMVMAISSHEEIVRICSSVRAQYNERGIFDTRAEVTDLEWIGDNLAVAKVRWPYLDKCGREIGAELSDYTLLRDQSGALKVREVLMRGVEAVKH